MNLQSTPISAALPYLFVSALMDGDVSLRSNFERLQSCLAGTPWPRTIRTSNQLLFANLNIVLLVSSGAADGHLPSNTLEYGLSDAERRDTRSSSAAPSRRSNRAHTGADVQRQGDHKGAFCLRGQDTLVYAPT